MDAVAAAASGWQGYIKTAGTESSAAYDETSAWQ
jgi:hypothetical protein